LKIAGTQLSGPALEIGPGFGYFAQLFWQRTSIPVDVVEPSKKAQARLQLIQFGGSIFDRIAAINHERIYSEIFCFHVVEHLQDLDGFFREVCSRLDHHGRIWVLTPNGSSLSYRVLKEKWEWAATDQHYLFISTKTPTQYFARLGLSPLLRRDLQPAIAHYPSYWRGNLSGFIQHLSLRINGERNLKLSKARKIVRRSMYLVLRMLNHDIFLDLEALWARATRRRPYDELLILLGNLPKGSFQTKRMFDGGSE
jgi:hypothetical protein